MTSDHHQAHSLLTEAHMYDKMVLTWEAGTMAGRLQGSCSILKNAQFHNRINLENLPTDEPRIPDVLPTNQGLRRLYARAFLHGQREYRRVTEEKLGGEFGITAFHALQCEIAEDVINLVPDVIEFHRALADLVAVIAGALQEDEDLSI